MDNRILLNFWQNFALLSLQKERRYVEKLYDFFRSFHLSTFLIYIDVVSRQSHNSVCDGADFLSYFIF